MSNGIDVCGPLGRDGYVLVPDVFGADQIESIGRAVQLQAAYLGGKGLPALAADWRDQKFHTALISLREKNPSRVARIYDTLQTNSALRGALLTPKVCSLVAEALSVDWSGLSATGEMLRMDFPGDTRNSLGWHQERSYYSQNRDGRNGLVLWAPLEDVGPSTGGLGVCPGSHIKGWCPVDSSREEGQRTSEQFVVPETALSEFEPIFLDAPAGSLVLFNMHLFHRSGQTLPNRVRLSVAVRFHKTLSEDFVPGNLTYVEVAGP